MRGAPTVFDLYCNPLPQAVSSREMKFPAFTLSALAAVTGFASALSPAEWRSQSIYQVLTDRFARTDGSTTAACNTQDGVYCGGTWQGIINKLDYIQNMGFTAVSPQIPTPRQMLTNDRSGYLLLLRTCPEIVQMEKLISMQTSRAHISWLQRFASCYYLLLNVSELLRHSK